jgi:hypothetical protein
VLGEFLCRVLDGFGLCGWTFVAVWCFGVFNGKFFMYHHVKTMDMVMIGGS